MNDRERHVELVASYEWFGVHVTDLDPRATRFAYNNDGTETEAELQVLAHTERAYLQGERHVTSRYGLIRRRRLTTLTIEAHGIRWRLGRRTSSAEHLNESRRGGWMRTARNATLDAPSEQGSTSRAQA